MAFLMILNLSLIVLVLLAFSPELDCWSSDRSDQTGACNTLLRESSTNHEGCSSSCICCSEDSMAVQVVLVGALASSATCFLH